MHRSNFLLFVLFSSCLLLSQTNTPLPSGFIDGSKTPDLIPDQAAFRLVFLSLTVPASPDDKTLARQNAFLKKIGLSDADQATLKTALKTFATNHSAWEQAEATDSSSPEVIAQGWAIVQATRDLLVSQLTADGNSKLFQYVVQAKVRMKVRP